MAIRFRKSIKLAPGLRLNVGKTGVSLSAGVRGASVTLGRGGTYLNAGLPGTGLSVRQRIGGGGCDPRSSRASAGREITNVEAKVRLADDGTIQLLDSFDRPLSPPLARVAKQQHGGLIRQLLDDSCTKRTALLKEFEEIHIATPAPDVMAPTQRPFRESPPAPPGRKEASFFSCLVRCLREAIERENQEAQQRYEEATRQWEARKQAHAQSEHERVREQLMRLKSEVAVMEEVLLQRMGTIEWPLETDVTFDLLQGGWTLALDVGLPEIEEMPDEEVSVAARGDKLSFKKLSQSRQRELYARHVHGVAMRLIGEAFAALPSLKRVLISGYTRRVDKGTGTEADTYIYSIVVARKDWSALNFRNLAVVDPIHALEAFDLRRSMTSTGLFRAIVPHDPQHVAA